MKGGIDLYLSISNARRRHPIVDLRDWADRRGSGLAIIEQITFSRENGERTMDYQMGEPIRLAMKVRMTRAINSPNFGFAILSNQHEPVFTTNLSDSLHLEDVDKGTVEYSVTINPCYLMPGEYKVAAAVTRGYVDAYDLVDNIPGFRVLESTAASSLIADQRWGHLFFRYPWDRQTLSGGSD